MLGKTLIKGKWYLCKVEEEKLYILKNECTKPIQLFDSYTVPENIFAVFMENGGVYYFDERFFKEEFGLFEYYHKVFKYNRFFVLDKRSRASAFSFDKTKKISFLNGILIPMMQNFDGFSYEFTYSKLPIKIDINKKQVNIESLCDMEFGTLILEKQDVLNRYAIDIEVETNDLDLVYKIIQKVYDFIRLLNLENNPCVSKIEIETTNYTLNYIDRDINYDCSKIGRFNYLGNIKENIGKILDFIFTTDKNFQFLSLLDKPEILFQDMNILAEAIESFSMEYDINLDDEISRDIKKYKDLKYKIKETINTFEQDNGQIDNDKKNFIINLIEVSKFRQKVEYLLRCYNEFAMVYPQYVYLLDSQILKISKDIQIERNNIHGRNEHVDKNRLIYEVQYVLFGLIIYILRMANLNDSEIFNLCNKDFCGRIQQLNV